MAFCTDCGCKVDERAKFCYDCGARILIPVYDTPKPAPAPEPAPVPVAEEKVVHSSPEPKEKLFFAEESTISEVKSSPAETKKGAPAPISKAPEEKMVPKEPISEEPSHQNLAEEESATVYEEDVEDDEEDVEEIPAEEDVEDDDEDEDDDDEAEDDDDDAEDDDDTEDDATDDEEPSAITSARNPKTDDYWNDIIPEIEEEVYRFPKDVLFKIGGAFLLLVLIIVWLIFWFA